jgi:hypothetical protein
MLNAVPASINRLSRLVTLRHPNAFDCIVSRKVITRVEPDQNGDPSEMGGAPTMGGMGVLRGEDEAEFDYVELGAAKLIFAGPGAYQPQDVIEHDNALLVERQREVLIESVAAPGAEPGEPQHFVADTGDLVFLIMEGGVVIAHEVATVSGTVNIPPYTRKLVLNPRDDLSYVEPFEA